MFKRLTIIFLLTIAFCAFAANFLLGRIAARAINDGRMLAGPDSMLSVDSLRINLLGGALGVNGLLFESRGEEDSFNLSINRGFADINALKLLDRKLVIEQVAVTGAYARIRAFDPVFAGIHEPAPGGTALPSPAAAGADDIQSRPAVSGPATGLKTSFPGKRVESLMLRGDALLKNLTLLGSLYFEDSRCSPPFCQGLKLKLTAAGLSTFAGPGTNGGTITLSGELDTDPEVFLVAAEAKVAPLTDPLRPDFELTARISRVDLALFYPYLKDTGVIGGTMEITALLVCRKGKFMRNKSTLKTVVSGIMFSKDAAERLPAGTEIPERLAFTAHVYGPFAAPRTDFTAALAGAVLRQVFNASLGDLFRGRRR